MGGVAFAVVQTGSFNNPTRPKGRPTISAIGVTNDTSVLVNFQNIPNVVPCNGGVRGVSPGNNITSYVAVANTGQIGTFDGSVAPGQTGLISVGGLTANTVYKFQVYGYNLYGRSDASLCSSPARTDTIAEAPVIGAITVSCTTASVPITVTTFNGGKCITSTTVNITGGPGTPIIQPGGAPFTAAFSGLTQSTSYTFTAFSTTPIGTGRSSSRGATTKGPVTINYMVVAGGGGGGRSNLNAGTPGIIGGGGGGGGGVTRGSFVKAPGTVLTFTVGGGGAGGPTTTGAGTQGTPSTLTCATTAVGGGYGNGWGTFNGGFGGGVGGPGGNGGGGAGRFISSTQPSPATPGLQPQGGGPGSQGFGGGTATVGPSGPPFPAFAQGGGGGGGGGAAATGGNSTAGGPSPAPACFPGRTGLGGTGGAGFNWPFTGLVYGSGAGGAQVVNPLGTPAAPGGGPGVGNGGAGGAPVNVSSAGSAGSGGGVFIAILTTQYPGTAPGATVTTPAAAPGYTVLQYPSPGTYTV